MLDYATEDDLRNALANICVADEKESPSAWVSNHLGEPIPDWKLPCPDPDAHEQSIDEELHRLLTLKSYLALDAEQEEALDRLTEEARQVYQVPTSLISLVDLGRQFFLSQAGNPTPHIRETPRNVAFCAHTILSKSGICVVNDTTLDDRFKDSKLVLEPPYLRFYAAAPLISPEGYKLGTFCVEGPEPRPNGLSEAEQAKLKEFAQKTMDLLVQRKKVWTARLHQGMSAPTNEAWRRHAAIATNVGGILYRYGECLTAMKLFQESVQTLMYVEEEGGGGLPSPERQEIFSSILTALSQHDLTDTDRRALIDQVKALSVDDPPSGGMLGPPNQCRTCVVDGIPGLFGVNSRLKGSVGAHHHEAGLVFAEAFQISMEDSRAVDYRNFIIPLNQCSKATLFNMGLIHYHWGSPDSALQFFDLAASLSQANTPLSFDPVVLGCLNNMAQINLQYGRANDAMELLGDALARGNAALAAMYSDDHYSDHTRTLTTTNINTTNSHQDVLEREQTDCRSRRLRRKLARTVMNMGHVHFFNCDYDQSMATCIDAMRLLHTTNMEDTEAAAAWYNMGILYQHKGNKLEALKYIDKFIHRARELVGPSVQVADGLFRKGQILVEMGHLYESMKPFNESLSIRRRILGDQHLKVAESLCAIGKVLQDREEYDFALNAFEEGLAIMRTRAGPQQELPLDAAQTLLEVGRAHHMLGHMEESLRVYKEVLDMARKFFGERHPFVARIVKIIGNLHLEAGDIDESLRLFADATKMHVEQGLPVDFGMMSDPLNRVENVNSHPFAPTA